MFGYIGVYGFFSLSVCFVNVLGCWYLSNISLKWPWFTGKCSLSIWFSYFKVLFWGFPGGSDGKASACNVGDLGLVPGLVRSPGEGKGYPLQYSALENSMDREDLQAVVHGVTKGCIQLDWATLTSQGGQFLVKDHVRSLFHEDSKRVAT